MSIDHDNRDRVRVLQVTHDLGIGGLPRVVETLSKHLDADRYDVEVLCLRDGGPLAERLARHGIESSVLDRRKTILRADYLTPLRIARHMRHRRPTIVHTHNTEPFIEAGVAAKLAGVPILVHTDHARDFPDKWRYMFAERIVSHLANAVVAVSDHGRDNLKQYIKVPRKKLFTIVNGVDGSDMDASADAANVRASFDIPSDAFVVGLGARFSEQKGITYLLQGLPRVLARHPNTFVVLAGYGPLEETLKQEAAELGVSERVRFVGRLDSMTDVLGILDVFVLPSIWEGLPMAILEAMAAGVPIVATNVGGVGAALEDDLSAVLVPPRDPRAFADGVVRMLDDPDLRHRIAERARREFDERFSAEAMADAYAELYESALGSRRAHDTAPS